MTTPNGMPNIEPPMPENAVSLYTGDGGEDFPVLKAFQQYIDAEQAKSRKRLITIAIFFTILIMLIVAVFVTLLIHMGDRNQSLNDRLVEYVMKERERASATASAQPAPSVAPDTRALDALTDKLAEMQKKLAESQRVIEQKVAAPTVAPAPVPSVQDLEIQRLKALLQAEKDKAEAEREKRRQEELEEYRRKHYPELYAPVQKTVRKRPVVVDDVDDLDDDTDLDDAIVPPKKVPKTPVSNQTAISYFDDGEDADDADEEDAPVLAPKKPAKTSEVQKPAVSIAAPAPNVLTNVNLSLPTDKKGTRRTWRVPQ